MALTLDQLNTAGATEALQLLDGTYEHSDAIRIFDAWWPLWLKAQFQPVLGKPAFDTLASTIATDNSPNGGGEHHGSAYQGSWYGFVSKDLRTVLGQKVRGKYAREYCGHGSITGCRRALESRGRFR